MCMNACGCMRMEDFRVIGYYITERQAYQKRMGLSDEQYINYTECVKELFDSRRLDTGSRFLRLSDAEYFYKKFCSTGFCRLVSVSTTSEYFELLAEEVTDGNGNRMVSGEPDCGRLIGCDILGWDVGGFHSFLCNSLQRELPEAEWNGIGLLKNDFGEVAQFADTIQGIGEPVEWIPCRIGEIMSGGSHSYGDIKN